ncbi:MAG: cell division protein FtsZ [Treponema sp.]|jgi:cell division protein FtsZ|nr:cell division protein FtsZ [Treponema sp.]
MEIFAVKEFEEFRPEALNDQQPAKIKVIGVGGGGCNAVNRMIDSGLSGVEFIAVNTDKQDLLIKSKAETRLQIGAKLTKGRGAGSNPCVGEDAANEDKQMISDASRDSDMVFVTAGMGGGTGTGAAPVIAKIASEHGSLIVGVVTKPFEFEGDAKMQKAEAGIKKLREHVDTLIIIPNENLFKLVDSKTSSLQAYAIADDVLRQAVQAITDLITKTGLINIDFADVQTTMKGQGDAHMGIGIGRGDNRAKMAADAAIDNPLLEDTGIEGATRLLVNICGPENVSMIEVKEIMATIKAKAVPNVETIFGQYVDPELGEDIKVTVIATGFNAKAASPAKGSDTGKKAETPMGDVISVEHFDRIRKGANIHSNDNYVGYVNRTKDISNNLEIPAYVRRNNLEDLDNAAAR